MHDVRPARPPLVLHRTTLPAQRPLLPLVRAMTNPVQGPALTLPDLTALADRHPDERDLLPALAVAIALGEDWLAEARRMRDYAALRLRQQGMTSRGIAEIAGVTDSYLARRAFDQGAPRRRRAPAQREAAAG